MIRQYRPATNVVERHEVLGARGYALTGHHEVMLPLLAFALVEWLAATQPRTELAVAGGRRG